MLGSMAGAAQGAPNAGASASSAPNSGAQAGKKDDGPIDADYTVVDDDKKN